MKFEPEPMEDEISYVRVTFKDGSRNDYPVESYDKLFTSLNNYIQSGTDDILALPDICGSRTAFPMHTVQDLYESTPDSRKKQKELNKILKEEVGWEEE